MEANDVMTALALTLASRHSGSKSLRMEHLLFLCTLDETLHACNNVGIFDGLW